MSRRPSDYATDPRAMSPASFHDRPMSKMSRPMTPGTPGTFDSNSGGFHSSSNVYLNRYDDPNNMGGRSPPLGSGNNYYFKEGGGAAIGANAAEHGAVAANAGKKSWFRRHPWLVALIVLVVVVIAGVGGGVGGVLGSKSSSNNSDLASNSGSSSSTGKTNGGSTTSSGKGSGTSTTSAAPPASTTVTALAKWNQTDPNSKIMGVSIGNWLVLERWLDEDWITGVAGDNVWDEWSFMNILGKTAAATALEEHWNTWVNETDLDTLKSVGINAVRIPVGYWAFVPTVSNEPYLAQGGQTDQLQKMLGWLYDRGMYALIDLHGLPGSQNGDQSSGHNTSNIQWFEETNFQYTYTALNATIDWIQKSNYSSVVQWICPVNEPRANSISSRQSQLQQYYEDAYHYIKEAGFIMMFHNAFESNPMSYWESFVTGKDPNYLVYNNNPYPGWFPAETSQSTIINSVCSTASNIQDYPVPVVMTEYSAINGVDSTSFNKEFLNTQLSAYAWSGGSFFWNFRAEHSTSQVLAVADNNMDEYSLLTLIAQGVISPITSGASTISTLKALPNTQCGNIPTASWTNPSTSG